MELYSKNGLLLLVQIDHLNGEILGGVVDHFYEAGAKNVQILSSITKKNRPAYVLLLDVPQDLAGRVEALIISECGSSGWRRISTCHRHTKVSVITKQIKVRTRKGVYDFTVEGKVIADDLENARVEYDACVKLRNLLLQKENTDFPLRQLNTALTQILHNKGKNELEI